MCGDRNGLQCVRDEHEDRGCVYEASAGCDNDSAGHVTGDNQ